MKRILLIPGLLASVATAVPVSNFAQPVDPGLLSSEPYRHNGLVLGAGGRGSGFVAENPRLFLTAAHVVRGDGGSKWGPPPEWAGLWHDANAPVATTPSRGYVRWTQYASLVRQWGAESPVTFSKDAVVVWGLGDFSRNGAALIDYRGSKTLRAEVSTMITGYPSLVVANRASGGYFLHSTGPGVTPFRAVRPYYLTSAAVSTGPGNDGGPVWVQTRRGWEAAGILVSSSGADSGVFGMNRSVAGLVKSTLPLVQTPMRPVAFRGGIGSTSYFMMMKRPVKVPDGKLAWTRIRQKSASVADAGTLSKVVLNLEIDTPTRGDLVVWLKGPGETVVELHNLGGGQQDDLIFRDMDLSSNFAGLDPRGRWELHVQDRVRGDRAVVTRFDLEISVD